MLMQPWNPALIKRRSSLHEPARRRRTQPGTSLALGPARDDLLDRCSAFQAARTHGAAHGLQPGFVSGFGVRDGAKPPQPQQIVKLPVLLWPPGTIHSGLVLHQE